MAQGSSRHSATGEVDGRRLRTLRSRQQVVEAAATLFAEHGYVATRIEDIAAAAGVAVQTVYYAFGSKPAVLAAVLDARIVGDLEPVALAARPWVESLERQCDPLAVLDELVAAAVDVLGRAASIYDVVRRAAADPEIAALLDTNRRARRADQRRLVEVLEGGGHLRPGLGVDEAADIFYALVNEDVYMLLTDDCGWTEQRFRRWLGVTLGQQLLGVGA